MSINERVRLLRKQLGLNQKEFGARVGLGQAGVSWMEQEGNTVIEQNIRLICAAYHINEEWLRDGTGEMESQPTNLLDTLAERYNLTDEKRALVEAFLELTDEQQEAILAAITAAAEKVRAKKQNAHSNKQDELDLFDGLDDRIAEKLVLSEDKGPYLYKAVKGPNGYMKLIGPMEQKHNAQAAPLIVAEHEE